MNYSTLAVHAGQHPDPLTGAVNVPVYLSSTFELTGIGTDKGWDGTRARATPPATALKPRSLLLKAATRGHAFASGMAAIYALVATLKTGDQRLSVPATSTAARRRLFNLIIQHYGIEIEYVDTSNLASVAAAIKPSTEAHAH